MFKNFDNLWVFGASFSTPDVCVSPKDSFWGLAASYLNVKNITNCSWPGNSFDSVCHVLISMQEQYDWDNDIFFIGIPPDATSTDRWRGHHGSAGNKLFFEKSIKPKLEELFC